MFLELNNKHQNKLIQIPFPEKTCCPSVPCAPNKGNPDVFFSDILGGGGVKHVSNPYRMTELFLFPFIFLIVINCERLHDGKSVAVWVVVFSILEFKLRKDCAVQFVALGMEVDVIEQQVEAAQ